MKKQTKLALLAVIMLVAVLILAGCGLADKGDNKDELSGLEVYTEEETPDYATFDDIEGITFKYPSNYKSIGKQSMPMYMDPDVAGATINVVTSDFPSSLTFEGYVEASIPGIKQKMTINGDINTKYINLNGQKAARLDYEATSSGVTMNITQVLIKKDGKAYILTLGALTSDKDKVSDKFEKIIKSFK